MRRKILLLALTLFLSSSCISCSKAFDTKPDEEIYIMSPPINIPNLHLNYFSKGRKDLLFRYLASSSKWHVTSVNGSLLALKRELSSSPCVPESLGLPSSYPGGKIPFPGGDFFDFSPEVSKDSYLPPQTRVDENTTIPLKMVKRYYTESLLIVEDHDKSLNLVIGESSDNVNRERTQKILIDISRQLDKLANLKSVNNQEIDPSILPPGSVKYSRNQIVSIKEKTRGDYIISGYINPGKKGFVYLNIIINKRSEQGSHPNTSSTNAEYVGWSIDPNKKFNFCLGASLNGYQSDQKEAFKNVPADVQLWFHPSDGSPESMIFSQSIAIPAFYQ